MGIPQEGEDETAKLLGAGLSGQSFGSVGIGTSPTAFSNTHGRLFSTLDTQTKLSATRNGHTMSLVGTFTGNSATVREASAYSDTNTILLARQVISTINVQNSDTLEITWDIKSSG